MGLTDSQISSAELAERVREQERELAELRARLAEWEAAFRRVPTRDISFTTISGARLCVGPMMKLPSAFTGALSPSGNSVAVT